MVFWGRSKRAAPRFPTLAMPRRRRPRPPVVLDLLVVACPLAAPSRSPEPHPKILNFERRLSQTRGQNGAPISNLGQHQPVQTDQLKVGANPLQGRKSWLAGQFGCNRGGKVGQVIRLCAGCSLKLQERLGAAGRREPGWRKENERKVAGG